MNAHMHEVIGKDAFSFTYLYEYVYARIWKICIYEYMYT